MITITFIGSEELQAKFASLPPAAHSAIVSKSQSLVQDLIDKIRDEKLDGQVLKVKTGKLRDSIQGDVDDAGDVMTGSVYVDGDVPYAAIQEYGGSTKAHIIEATNGKALAFNWQGKAAFFQHVNHPGSVLPERSYLRSSLAEMQSDIVTAMADALNEAIESL